MMVPAPEIREKYIAWWQGKNRGPLLFITAGRAGSNYLTLDRPRAGWERSCRNSRLADAMHHIERDGDWDKLEQTVTLWDEAQAATLYAGVGYPFVRVNTGPGSLASYISGFSRYAATGDGTVWFHLDEPMSWERIMAAGPDPQAHWWVLTERCIRRIAQWASGRYFLAQPNLGGPLDVLAALRTSNQLLFDCMDCRAQVEAAQRHLESLWAFYFDRVTELFTPCNGPASSTWLQVWAPGRCAALECDFSAMISPPLFEELVMPSLVRQCDMLDQAVYHLDGQSALPHLDRLLTLDKVAAIQWAPIGGTVPAYDESWYPLYRRIIDAGKRVVLLGFPAHCLDALFARLPRGAFFMTVHCPSEEEARTLAEKCR